MKRFAALERAVYGLHNFLPAFCKQNYRFNGFCEIKKRMETKKANPICQLFVNRGERSRGPASTLALLHKPDVGYKIPHAHPFDWQTLLPRHRRGSGQEAPNVPTLSELAISSNRGKQILIAFDLIVQPKSRRKLHQPSSFATWQAKAKLKVIALLSDPKTAPPPQLLNSKEFKAGLRR
jgi:hypothetical protein